MTMGGWLEIFSGTYGGWLRNPVPVDRWFIPLSIGFQSSKVMQGFFHPQYIEKPLEPLGQLCT